MSTVTEIRPQHELFSSMSNEWYTPSVYVEAARKVMGSIDLDPASCELANRTVRATMYYSQEDNGLAQSWYGNTWVNPPYGVTRGKSNQGIWSAKAIAEYKQGSIQQAILLVNAKTDTRWFVQLWDFMICFTNGRVSFKSAKSKARFSNTNGSAFVYLGSNEQKFIATFSQFGRIARAVDIPQQHEGVSSSRNGGEE